MEFYGFTLMASPSDEHDATALLDLLDMAKLADANGLDGLYLAEHHGDSEFSILTAPSVVLGALAMATSRLRLGTMITILPFNHPLRVAEEIRTLDALSGGRIEVGFGRGQIRHEQAAFGVDRDATVEMFDFAYDIVVRLLRGERVDYKSNWWSGEGAFAVPEPVQVPTPPIWMAAASTSSIEKCAVLGTNCATALLTRKLADERLAEYREAWHHHQGTDKPAGKYSISASVAVADTTQNAINQLRHELEHKKEHFGRAVTDKPGAQDSTYLTHKITYDAFQAATFDEMLDDGLMIAGTVDECRDQVKRIQERGIDRLLCTFHNPYTRYEESRASMELFLTEVMPVARSSTV